MRRRQFPGLGLRVALGVLGVLGAGTLAPAETACAPGSELVEGLCRACGVGYFSDSHDAHACFECPGGYYTPSTASSVCTPCEAGKASAPAWNQTACVFCPAGTFNPFRIVLARGSLQPTSTECHGCLKGKYSAAEASTTCTECALGKYQSATGKSECLQCGPGKYGTTQAQVTEHECGLCGAGHYATLGNTDCEACPAGKFAPFMSDGGVDECVACEAPFVAEGPGNYKCELCREGRYYVDATECRECEAGKYAPVEHQAACVECEAGTYQPAVGGSACVQVFDDTVEGADTATLQHESKADEVTGVPGWRLVRFMPVGGQLTSGDGFVGTLVLGSPFTYVNVWSVSFGEFSEILAGKCSLDTGGDYIWIDNSATFHTYDKYAAQQLTTCGANISNFNTCASTLLVKRGSYYYRLSIDSATNKVSIFKPSSTYSIAAQYGGLANAIYGENFAGTTAKMCLFVRDSSGTSRTPRAVEARKPGATGTTACRPGTKEDRTSGICATCARGKYQAESGRTACNECASGKTTARRGATSAAHCWISDTQQCSNAGEMPIDNEGTCEPCPAGTYLSTDSSDAGCKLCPAGFTSAAGQTGVDACGTDDNT